MRPAMPPSYRLRAICTIHDRNGRGYMPVSPGDQIKYGLPRGQSWWWCVLKYGTPVPPRVGARVGSRMVYRVAFGFERGRSVGVVGMR